MCARVERVTLGILEMCASRVLTELNIDWAAGASVMVARNAAVLVSSDRTSRSAVLVHAGG